MSGRFIKNWSPHFPNTRFVSYRKAVSAGSHTYYQQFGCAYSNELMEIHSLGEHFETSLRNNEAVTCHVFCTLMLLKAETRTSYQNYGLRSSP